ncbi:MAG: 23S rRNA (uracil(1939)-C(5))-methyltransferase RlmD [Lachnospiraceae bacterium]|nr:23S rRNA (uracil(1939)-C(5))-methyltransferase RlmD [Lachnospiraceae bacterium]
MGIDGEGIGKLDGYTFFVKDAVIGDTVEAKVMKAKNNYAYAKLINIITPSQNRTEPKCQFHKQCGGCQIQALDYKTQLLFKQNKVKNNMLRIGGFSQELLDSTMETIVGMETPYYYRNKAQFPIGKDNNDNIITGFYAGRTHSIISNTNCALGVTENKMILEIILKYMQENKITAYDETTGKGIVRHVLIRKGFTSGEIMVCVIINSDKLSKSGLMVEALRTIDGMTSISININKEKTNVIMGSKCQTIWGKDTISDTIHMRTMEQIDSGKDSIDLYQADGISFNISPLSFYQVNPVQTEKLYSIALEYAGLTGTETVWDLYCGIGTISLFMAKRAKQVYGIEIIDKAIEDARLNASNNNIDNAKFYVGKAEEVLPELYEKEGIYADVICVDPPRKGCDEKCLSTILKMAPKRIVYVSCDSATLARDLKILCENDYEITKIRPVDMFPNTVHVETVVLLSQRKADDYVEVELELDELDVTSAETKATYAEIKDYVLKEHGLKVSNLYISQVKRKCGIEVGENYNLPKSEDSRQPQCPKEKEKAIRDALEHFGMV